MLLGSLHARNQSHLQLFAQNHTNYPPHLMMCAFHLHRHADPDLTDSGDGVMTGQFTIEEAEQACRLMYLIYTIIAGSSLLIGVPGNIMAAVTALSMDAMSSSSYLFFLAIGDIFALLARTGTPVTTKLSFEIFKYSSGFFSNFVLMLVCLERYMAVCHPWFKKRFYTLQTAHRSIATLAVIYVFVLVGMVQLTNQSTLRMSSLHMINVTLLFGVPCPLIVIFNCLTIKRLRKMSKSQLQGPKSLKFWTKIEASITYMMIVASAVFLFLNGPKFFVCLLWFCLDQLLPGHDLEHNPKFDFALNFTYWLTFVHHSINFYLYILGTQRFRYQAVKVLKKMGPDVNIVSKLSTEISKSLLSARRSGNVRKMTTQSSMDFIVRETESIGETAID